MEFLELLMVFIAVVIMIKKPEMEKLAYGLVVVSWLMMLFFYMGHKSANLLTNINL